MRELLMLRHGLTEHNEKRLFTGATDVPLSENGRAYLAPLKGTYPKAVRFFTSGMLRAVETLVLLYGDVPRMDIPALGEYHFGAFEGRSHADLYESEPLYRAWLKGDNRDIVLPGGESRSAFGDRVREGFASLVAQPWEGLGVLVSHGGVLSTLLPMLGLSEEGIHPPQNACGWRIGLSTGGEAVSLEAFP